MPWKMERSRKTVDVKIQSTTPEIIEKIEAEEEELMDDKEMKCIVDSTSIGLIREGDKYVPLSELEVLFEKEGVVGKKKIESKAGQVLFVGLIWDEVIDDNIIETIRRIWNKGKESWKENVRFAIVLVGKKDERKMELLKKADESGIETYWCQPVSSEMNFVGGYTLFDETTMLLVNQEEKIAIFRKEMTGAGEIV